jgi:hypothetical protein
MLNNVVGLLGGAAPEVGDYESIATYTATGGETAFNFTSISSSYKHLQFRILARRTTGINAVVALQFNGDTASNYWWHLLEGNGSTATSSAAGAAANRIQTFWINPSVNLADQYGAGVIDILDYANTNKNKTVRALGGGDANGTGKINLASGSWTNTAAITSVNVYFLGDAVTSGSSFALYGIK